MPGRRPRQRPTPGPLTLARTDPPTRVTAQAAWTSRLARRRSSRRAPAAPFEPNSSWTSAGATPTLTTTTWTPCASTNRTTPVIPASWASCSTAGPSTAGTKPRGRHPRTSTRAAGTPEQCPRMIRGASRRAPRSTTTTRGPSRRSCSGATATRLPARCSTAGGCTSPGRASAVTAQG